MNPERLLKHFDEISEAPDAVPRLRRFILDLAVRGKLVAQDPGDEPAGELLERIETQETLPGFPPQWWAGRVGELLNMRYGKALLARDRKHHGEVRVYGSNGVVGYCDSALAKEPAIIIGRKGSAGALNLCDGPSWTTDVAYFLVPPAFTSIHFLFFTLKALDLESLGKGVKPGLSRTEAYQLPLVLPPLAEQHRIVAKVDELMALCDELEAARSKRESRRAQLVGTTLHRLNNGDSVEADAGLTFKESARFYFNHLPRLTTRPEHIKALRQTILDLAVRGKLVAQDPGDEPANVLFSRIQEKKWELIAAGQIKKDKRLWDGISESPPFTIPSGWIWVRLQDVFEISRGGSPRPAGDPHYFGGDMPWITVREITKDSNRFLTATEGSLTSAGVAKSRVIAPDDLLLTNSGATLGVPKISHIRGCINDGVAVLRLFHSFNLNNFAYEFLCSQTSLFRRLNQGMGQPNLNTPIIAAWHFPLPPLREQNRIVAKIADLMAVCDEIEVALVSITVNSRRLLEGMLCQMLEPCVHDARPSIGAPRRA